MRMRANPLMSACIVCFVLTELKFFSICLSCVSYFFAVVHGIEADLREFYSFRSVVSRYRSRSSPI